MNRLQKETSLYLLQHKDNPVDWFPWGIEALEKAQIENKVIILSVGYSACHWCHVMEHESFEKESTAQIMNTHFVNIKVDREERPDIDSIYMEALQAMGLRGGWPLNVFLMPNRKPFYGGTYFSNKNWENLLYSIQEAYLNNYDQLKNSSESFANSLNLKDSEKYNFASLEESELKLSSNELERIIVKLSSTFDLELGGMQRSPKFPMPSVWQFLLSYVSLIDRNHDLKHLKNTLDRIALGGIFDHLAGGWTRYSTDERWKIPHFEKMLYDNGQLISLYSKSIILFKSKCIFEDSVSLYNWAISSTINWLKLEMTNKLGGFYSAQDADSEGVEGKYYVWTESEINDILGKKAKNFNKIYSISQDGNWENGHNVFHLEGTLQNESWKLILECHKDLISSRNKRVKPGLDSKILCGWNGLMLNGLVGYFKWNQNQEVFNIIKNNATFIEKYLTLEVVNENNEFSLGLWHQVEIEKVDRVLGFLDDYAAVIQAYINYYQICFDEKWLSIAKKLVDYTIDNFLDVEEQLFFYTDIQSEKLIARKKEIFDNVIPSSNALMAKNLYFLGRIYEKEEYSKLSKSMYLKLKNLLIQDPQWLSCWSELSLFFTFPEVDIAIVGDNYLKLAYSCHKHVYYPNALVYATNLNSDLPIFKNRLNLNKIDTNIFVCKNKTCNLPVNTVESALILIKSEF